MRRPWLAILAILAILATACSAQPAAPPASDEPATPTEAPTASPPASEEPTEAASEKPSVAPSEAPPADELEYQLPPNFGSEDLTSGFTPDPFSVEVTSGGPIDASYLGGDCRGFATAAPGSGATSREPRSVARST